MVSGLETIMARQIGITWKHTHWRRNSPFAQAVASPMCMFQAQNAEKWIFQNRSENVVHGKLIRDTPRDESAHIPTIESARGLWAKERV